MMRHVRSPGQRALRAALVVVAWLGTARLQADTIDTTPAWDGQSYVSLFGSSNSATATYGQTVTAPAGSSTLNGFSFAMNLPGTVVFRGEVFAWDGTRAVGPSLFESAPRSTTGSGNFESIAFNTNGVGVTAGKQYVLFASISKDFASSSDFGSWGFVTGNPYPGGNFVFLDSGNDPSQWTSAPWQSLTGNAGDDLAFQASFGTTGGTPTAPEPGSLTLVGMGVGAIAGWGWRRQRTA